MFTLGPHIDGGGLERWEDPGFRGCFKEILSGDWRSHDAFDATRRIGIKQDLYNTSCVRPFSHSAIQTLTGAFVVVNVLFSVPGRDGRPSQLLVPAKALYAFSRSSRLQRPT